MIVNKGFHTMSRICLLVLLGYVVSTPFSVPPCNGAAESDDEPRFSLEIVREPLKAVLKKISRITAYEIAVDEKWETYPVTASLRGVTIRKGLARMLGRLDHAIVVNDKEKRVSIVIFDYMLPAKGTRKNDGRVSPSGQSSEDKVERTFLRRGKALSRSPEIDPGDIEVIPPSRPGEQGITQRKMDEIELKSKKIDPEDIEVIPPARPGERGITQRELDAGRFIQEKAEPGTSGAVPPDNM